jgi:hypothetical protein
MPRGAGSDRYDGSTSGGAAGRGDPAPQDVAGSSPAGIIRLVGTVPAEQNDEWTESRTIWDLRSSLLTGSLSRLKWDKISLAGLD